MSEWLGFERAVSDIRESEVLFRKVIGWQENVFTFWEYICVGLELERES